MYSRGPNHTAHLAHVPDGWPKRSDERARRSGSRRVCNGDGGARGRGGPVWRAGRAPPLGKARRRRSFFLVLRYHFNKNLMFFSTCNFSLQPCNLVRSQKLWVPAGLSCCLASHAASCWCRCLGCRFPRVSSIAAVHLARPLTSQPLERACVMLSSSDHRALGVFARRVLHVSAASRRGAAPYADDCERYFGRSHLISH